MIPIQKSSTADSRTCDFTKVTKAQLFQSSCQHIDDVRRAMTYFAGYLNVAAACHDDDKLTDVDGFYKDFVVGFATTDWWDNHRKITRHHLFQEDGIPADVNLLDVLELIADCVMAGMGRAGEVYPLDLPPALLMKAFLNTVELLKKQVVICPESPDAK